MGKISNLLSKGMSENDKKELQQALTQLNHLNAKLTAKYTLANDLEHIKDGRTAAAKLIKTEIEQLKSSINEVDQLKTELKLEVQNILSLKQKIDDFKETIEFQFDDGTTTLETLRELLDSNNVSQLHSKANAISAEHEKYFHIQDHEESSYSQKLSQLSLKSKEIYAYLFNNDVVFDGIETSREQIIKKKYQEIDQYYDHIFINETDESGEEILSFSNKLEKQKNTLDKFYLKIFGDEKNPSLETILKNRLENLANTEKEAIKVLNLSSNAGLAGGFYEKGVQAKNSKQNNLYVFIGALVLLAAFNFFTINFDKLDEITITSITVRLILNIPLIWIATVANINLNKYSKLEQEYGHKEALARSFEKYKTEIQTLNSENEESIYLQTKLLEINLDAFKKNPAEGMELAKSDSFLDKLFSNSEKKIEKESSSPERP